MKLNMLRLDEFCDSVRDGTHDTPQKVDNGYKLITAKHINNTGIDFSEAYFISEKDYNHINERSKVEKWDVLMSMIGNGLGKTFVVSGDPDYAIKNLALFKIGEENKAKWLHYYLSSSIGQNLIYSKLQGTGQPFISLSFLRKMKIPVPDSYCMLCKITSILSAYDNLIENNNRRIRLLEQMAENLYKEWFVRFRFPGHEKAEFENGLPKGWRVERLEKIASFHTGRTDASEIKLYVSTENMIPNFGGIDFNLNIVPPNGNIISVEDKDILISNIRPYFKKIWFSNQRCGCSADVLNIRANNKDYSEYLYHSLRTDNFFDHIVAGSNGTKMPRGNKDFTMKYPIIVPSEEIMIIYSSIVGKMTQKRIKLQKENSLLSRQRDLLLPRLMSGKLEVK